MTKPQRLADKMLAEAAALVNNAGLSLAGLAAMPIEFGRISGTISAARGQLRIGLDRLGRQHRLNSVLRKGK